MHCITVNQASEVLSANMHFQLHKLMQFCCCLCRTAMHLCHCCMAAIKFVGYYKCNVVHICNERCTTRYRINFHLILAFVRTYFNINIFLLCLNWF